MGIPRDATRKAQSEIDEPTLEDGLSELPDLDDDDLEELPDFNEDTDIEDLEETPNTLDFDDSENDDAIPTEDQENEFYMGDPDSDNSELEFDDDFEEGLPIDFDQDEEPNSDDELMMDDDEDSDSPDLEDDDSDKDNQDNGGNSEESDEDKEGFIGGEQLKDFGKKLLTLVTTLGTKVSKLFSKLPLIGKFFTSSIGALVSLGLVIVVPIVLIFGISMFSRSMTAPEDSSSISLPDEGSVQITNMKLSPDKKTVTAELENTGDVIADVTPSVNIRSVTLNPISWFKTQDNAKCTAKTQEIDIDKTKQVVLNCTKITGRGHQLEGILHE